MFSKQEAEELVSKFLGEKEVNSNLNWKLIDFEAGWLVIQEGGDRQRGAGTLVVERGSGRFLLFPSSVPVDRITSQYSTVAHRGTQVNKTQKSRSDA